MLKIDNATWRRRKIKLLYGSKFNQEKVTQEGRKGREGRWLSGSYHSVVSDQQLAWVREGGRKEGKEEGDKEGGRKGGGGKEGGKI